MVDVQALKAEAMRLCRSFYDHELAEAKRLYPQPVPLFVAYGGACLALFFLSFIVLPVLSSTYRKSKFQVKLDWSNRAVAMAHAVVMSYFAYSYWLKVQPLWEQNLTNLKIDPHLDDFEGDTMRLMTGYMIYDLLIELFTPETLNLEVLFHHIVGLSSHFHTLAVDDGPSGFYTMLVYLAEASTPLLHLGWMMHTADMSGSVLFLLLTGSLLLVFFLCRVALSPLLVVAYFAPQNRQLYAGRDGVYYFQAFIVFAFVGLNLFWFQKLLSLALRKARGESKSPDKRRKRD